MLPKNSAPFPTGRNERARVRERLAQGAVLAAWLIVAVVAGACRPQSDAPERAQLARFDSILVELGGDATEDLTRGQRWRMISSTGAGLPPIDFEPDLLPEPESPGARMLQFYCVQCHGLPVPHMHTAEEWPTVLRRMVLRIETLSRHMGGAVTERLLGEMRMAGMAATEVPTPQQQDTLLSYLKRHAFPGATRAELPDAAGKDLYLRRCGSCHAPPTPAAHTAEEWALVVGRMQGNMSAMDVEPLDEAERRQVLDYLRRAAEAPR